MRVGQASGEPGPRSPVTRQPYSVSMPTTRFTVKEFVPLWPGACLCGLDVSARGAETCGVIEFVLLIAKGLIRSQDTRRQIMFYALVVAMLLLLAGGTFLQGWLRETVWLLVAWWSACGALTLFAALLAIFDLLVLRLAARRLRRELENAALAEARAERER